MTLTPLDIHNKEFGRGFRGYAEAEVDEFLDEVVKEFEVLIRENGELKDRLDELEQALERYRTIEDSLNKTLLLAQQAGDEIRELADKEGRVIRDRATMEAERIVADAKTRARQAVADYTEIRKETELFRMRMKTLLQAQLELFEEAALKASEEEGSPWTPGAKAEGIISRYSGGNGDDEGSPDVIVRESPPRGDTSQSHEDDSLRSGDAGREEAAALDYDFRPREAAPVEQEEPWPRPAETKPAGTSAHPNLWGEPVGTSDQGDATRSAPTTRPLFGDNPGEEDDSNW